jgi:hypothetical protein
LGAQSYTESVGLSQTRRGHPRVAGELDFLISNLKKIQRFRRNFNFEILIKIKFAGSRG